MEQEFTNELIHRSRQNDTQAFRQLMEEYQTLVFRLAFRLLCDSNEAQDVVQETFVKAWTHLDHFDCRLKFSTWLCKITTNLCYDQLRTRKRRFSFVDDTAVSTLAVSADECVETAMTNRELVRLITELTADLTPKQRLVFTLRDLEGMELDEVETITGLSGAKIKSNLYLARQYVREKMQKMKL